MTKPCERCGGTGHRKVGPFEALCDEFRTRSVAVEWEHAQARVETDLVSIRGGPRVFPKGGGPAVFLDAGEHYGPNAETEFVAAVRALIEQIGGWEALVPGWQLDRQPAWRYATRVLITNHDRTVTISRRTAYVVDAVAVAGSVSVTRQPARAGCLRVTLAGGTSGTGTVTITGTVDGVAGQSEALTFTENASKTTSKRFSAISAITTTGLADETTPPTFSMQSIGPDGSPQPTSYTLVSNWPATKQNPGGGAWPSPTQGSSPDEESVFLVQYAEIFEPRRSDILRDDTTGEDWHVDAAPLVRGGLRRLFWRIRAHVHQA